MSIRNAGSLVAQAREEERAAIAADIRRYVDADPRPVETVASAQRVMLRWVAGCIERGEPLSWPILPGDPPAAVTTASRRPR